MSTMPFTAAVRAGLANYARFRGRASRAEFWWFLAFAFIVVGGLDVAEGEATALPSALAALALTPPLLSVSARRLHDAGRSGWWLLAALAPALAAPLVLVVGLLPPAPRAA